MSDEPDWTKIWVAAVFGVAVVALAIVVSIAAYCIVIDKAAIEAGLEEGTVPGLHGTHWVARKK